MIEDTILQNKHQEQYAILSFQYVNDYNNILTKHLEQKKLLKIHVIGDGNCLYYCLQYFTSFNKNQLLQFARNNLTNMQHKVKFCFFIYVIFVFQYIYMYIYIKGTFQMG